MTITRAKFKLLMVGSAQTLSSVPFLASLLAIVREKQWDIQLPADALECLPAHCSDEFVVMS